MKIRNVAMWGIMLCAIVGLTQCTLEDEMNTSQSQGLRLSYVTVGGDVYYSLKYDKQGRLTYVRSGSSDEYSTLEVSYDPLEMVETDYDDSNKDVSIFSNIELNSEGYIKSLTYTENRYVDGVLTESDVTSSTCEYDSSGHLVKVNTVGEGQTTYQWSNGNLISMHDSDGWSITYTYLSTPNTYGQWLLTDAFDPVFLTGLLGKAPANLVESQTDSDADKTSFAYQTNNSGYIEKIKANYYGDTFIMNLYYTK